MTRPSAQSCARRSWTWSASITREAFAAREFVPGPVAGAGRRPRLRRRGDALAGRFRARLLADDRPLRRPVRARVRPLVRRARLRCWSTPARRPTCWRCRALTSPKLGDRRLRPGDEVITVAAGFPDHGQSDRPERPGAGVRRRRRFRPTTSTSTQLEAALSAAHAGRHARAHAGQSVRPRRGDGVRAASTTSG